MSQAEFPPQDHESTPHSPVEAELLAQNESLGSLDVPTIDQLLDSAVADKNIHEIAEGEYCDANGQVIDAAVVAQNREKFTPGNWTMDEAAEAEAVSAINTGSPAQLSGPMAESFYKFRAMPEVAGTDVETSFAQFKEGLTHRVGLGRQLRAVEAGASMEEIRAAGGQEAPDAATPTSADTTPNPQSLKERLDALRAEAAPAAANTTANTTPDNTANTSQANTAQSTTQNTAAPKNTGAPKRNQANGNTAGNANPNATQGANPNASNSANAGNTAPNPNTATNTANTSGNTQNGNANNANTAPNTASNPNAQGNTAPNTASNPNANGNAAPNQSNPNAQANTAPNQNNPNNGQTNPNGQPGNRPNRNPNNGPNQPQPVGDFTPKYPTPDQMAKTIANAPPEVQREVHLYYPTAEEHFRQLKELSKSEQKLNSKLAEYDNLASQTHLTAKETLQMQHMFMDINAMRKQLGRRGDIIATRNSRFVERLKLTTKENLNAEREEAEKLAVEAAYRSVARQHANIRYNAAVQALKAQNAGQNGNQAPGAPAGGGVPVGPNNGRNGGRNGSRNGQSSAAWQQQNQQSQQNAAPNQQNQNTGPESEDDKKKREAKERNAANARRSRVAQKAGRTASRTFVSKPVN